MLQIKEAAARLGQNPSRLRYYDDIGLAQPSERSPGNYRLYSEADLERLRLVEACKSVGLSLDDIRIILEQPKMSVLKTVFRKRRLEVEASIREGMDQRNRLASWEDALADQEIVDLKGLLDRSPEGPERCECNDHPSDDEDLEEDDDRGFIGLGG
jgi:DNA-binding transcriptional MerR regulator